MKATDNAFPYQLDEGNGNVTVYMGLNVRDYIAIQAMTGLLAGISASHGRTPMPSYESIAKDCYKMADAIIKQSEENQNEQSI